MGKVIHLRRLEPAPGESIKSYALKYVPLIDTESPYVLVGLSFGGMIATELHALLQPARTLLISSCGSRHELPPWLRAAGQFRLHRLLRPSMVQLPTFLRNWFSGIDNPKDRALVNEMLEDTPRGYLIWASGAIITWRRTDKPAGVFHVHGTDDHLLPHAFVKPDISIPGGTHMMVLNKADYVTAILSAEIKRTLAR